MDADQRNEDGGGFDQGKSASVLEVDRDVIYHGLIYKAKEEALSQEQDDGRIAVYSYCVHWLVSLFGRMRLQQTRNHWEVGNLPLYNHK